MSKHLKTKVFSRLTRSLFRSVPSPFVSTSHARGVRYLEPITAIEFYCGTMSTVKEGRKYHKHIIVRRVPGYKRLHQLYTYHFPKTWSAACVANRELIKLAQRQAHALEHDHSHAGIEWRIRFFKHYFHVCKQGGKPEPGLKPYTRFYQYTYVSIYRELQAARNAALKTAQQPTEEVTIEPITAPMWSSARRSPAECQDLTFSPIIIRPRLRSPHSVAVQSAFNNVRPLQANTIRRSSLPFREGPGIGFPSPLSPPTLATI